MAYTLIFLYRYSVYVNHCPILIACVRHAYIIFSSSSHAVSGKIFSRNDWFRRSENYYPTLTQPQLNPTPDHPKPNLTKPNPNAIPTHSRTRVWLCKPSLFLLLLTHFGESPEAENLFPPIFWQN